MFAARSCFSATIILRVGFTVPVWFIGETAVFLLFLVLRFCVDRNILQLLKVLVEEASYVNTCICWCKSMFVCMCVLVVVGKRDALEWMAKSGSVVRRLR